MFLALIISAMTSTASKDFCRKHLIDHVSNYPGGEELERGEDEKESLAWEEARKREEEEMRGRFHDHWPRGEGR